MAAQVLIDMSIQRNASAVEVSESWALDVSNHRAARALKTWAHGAIEVLYEPILDGGGTFMAEPFLKFIREKISTGKPFDRLFEWCGGPGFLGFAALAEGLCETLCVADISPRAIEMVQRTIAHNGLADRVTCYVSDNFKSIPASEKFDLVVANPPNFYQMNEAHPFAAGFIGDARPVDPGWRIHKDFYANVAQHLNPGAFVLVSEVEPHAAELYAPRAERLLFDTRPRPPIEDFKRMIEGGGLVLLDCVTYATWGEIELAMVASRRA
jgi:methylase of polypeptide subunit release factors